MDCDVREEFIHVSVPITFSRFDVENNTAEQFAVLKAALLSCAGEVMGEDIDEKLTEKGWLFKK